jgi:hypothetical protein
VPPATDFLARRAVELIERGEHESAFALLEPLGDAITHDRDLARLWLDVAAYDPDRARRAATAVGVLSAFADDHLVAHAATRILLATAAELPPASATALDLARIAAGTLERLIERSPRADEALYNDLTAALRLAHRDPIPAGEPAQTAPSPPSPTTPSAPQRRPRGGKIGSALWWIAIALAAAALIIMTVVLRGF